jgi:chromosome segregation ATPase
LNLTFRRLGVSELLPRYIFAESLFVRRRVLEVGAVSATGGATAEFLVSRGARLVVACDDDLTAVEAAQARSGSERLRFRPAVFDDLPPGGFDLVLVADLAPYVRAPALLAQLTEQVSGTGVLVGGVRNPAGLALAQLMEPDGDGAPPTYGQVLDALAAHFPHVETATQSPLLGYQLAFERSEGLQVDGSLAGSGEAAYYVVLASRERLRAVDPTWVQLPPAPLAFTGGRLDEVSTRAREWEERARRLKTALGEAREELGQARADLEATQGALERAREEAARVQAEAEVRGAAALHPVVQDELAARIRRLEAELQLASDRAGEAERRLTVRAAESEAARVQERQQQAEVLAAQESVRLERARREELQRQLDDARTKLTTAYDELRGVREELTRNRTDTERGRLTHEARGSELAALEERLSQARERELRLAEQHSLVLTALEGSQGELAQARSRAEALEQRTQWLEAERVREQRAAETDRARFEEQIAEARAAAASGPTPAEMEALRTELLAASGERERLADRAAVLEKQEASARALCAALEERLANAEATLAQANFQTSQDAAITQELAIARQALEEAQSAAAAARAERDRDMTAISAELVEARAMLARVEERASTTAVFAREAVARAERAEEDMRQQAQRAETQERAMAALELQLRRTEDVESQLHSLKAWAEAEAEADAARQAELVRLEEARAALEKRLVGSEAELARLERELTAHGELQEAHGALQARVAELEAEAARLSQESSTRGGALAETESELASARVRLGELEAAEAKVLAERDSAQEAARSASAESAQLEGRLASLEQRLAEADEQNAQLSQAVEEAQGAASSAAMGFEARVAALEVELQHTAAALAEKSDALAHAEPAVQELSLLRGQQAEAVARAEAFGRALEDARGRVETLEAALAGADEARGTLVEALQRARTVEAELGPLRAERDLIASERDAAMERLTAVEAAGQETAARLASLEAGQGGGEEQARAVKQAREQVQVELAQERARARMRDEEKEFAEGRVAELEEQLVKLTDELASVQFERDALAVQAEQAAAREQSLTEALEAAQAAGAGPGALQQMLAEAVAARDAIADERAREREEAREQVDAAQAHLQELSTRVDQLQRRLAAQEGELLTLRRALARPGPRRPGEGES